MLQKPFDNLPTVTKLLELRKQGVKTVDLSNYFGCAYSLITETLRYHENKIVEIKENTPKTVGKYDYLLNEPVNKGHDYDEILKKHGYKKPKLDSFDKIRKFKIKEHSD